MINNLLEHKANVEAQNEVCVWLIPKKNEPSKKQILTDLLGLLFIHY